MVIDNGQVKRAFCASRRAYPISAAGLASQAEQAREAAIGYVGASRILYSGDVHPKLQAAGVNVEVLPAGPVAGQFMRESVTFGVTGAEIMVAFRGTLPPDFLDLGLSGADWLNDAQTNMTAVAGVAGVLYHAHKGFWFATSELWKQLKPELDALVAANPALPVVFTGHSKGGAMAQIAAVLFGHAAQTVHVCTFASARAGDAAFVAAFNAMADDARRYEYGADVVPHLPPSSGAIASAMGMSAAEIAALGSYASAGAICYLPTLSPPAGGAPGQVRPLRASDVMILSQAQADADCLAAITSCVVHQHFTLNLKDVWVGQNHSIDPLSGYDRWIF